MYGDKKQSTNLKIREQLFSECRAMVDYALKRGKNIPSSTLETVELFEYLEKPERSEGDNSTQDVGKSEGDDSNQDDGENIGIANLVNAHDKLSELVDPATPQAILLIQFEQKKSGFSNILGPVPLVRQMMLVAIISLFTFIGVVLSPDINHKGTTIFNSQGTPLLINLLFLLSAAGLGASFAALYKANKYITNLTFDPTNQASYWVRFLLGLISGLILALVISGESIKTEVLEDGIVRPLLALLGGFSADLAYTFLNRMVETVKSLFQGSSDAIISANTQKEKAKLVSSALNNQMKLAASLMKVQQSIGANSKPEEILAKLNQLFDNVMPGGNMLSLQNTR